MRITDLLDRRSIALDAKPASKKEALDTVIQLMIDSGKIKDAEAYRKEVYRREEEGTTGTDNQKVSAVSQTGKVFISQHAGSLSYRPG